MPMMSLISRLVLCGVAALLSAIPIAAQPVFHVRSGATGSGSGTDWNNAFAKLPGTLKRGATYYIAAGSYPAPNFTDAESGTNLISILKATESAHGSDTGWTDDFARGVALFQGTTRFQTGYYRLDGMTGSGKTGHGFELVCNRSYGIVFGSVRSISVQHCNLHQYPADVLRTNMTDYTHLIYAAKGGGGFLFQSNYFHHVFGCPFFFRSLNGVTIEHNYIEKNRSSGADEPQPNLHSEGISDNYSSRVTARWNKWCDIEGTAFIALIAGKEGIAEDWHIHGNVFWHTGTWTAKGVADIISVIEDANNHSIARNWKVINNTIANITGVAGIRFFSIQGSNNWVMNNYVWQNRSESPAAGYVIFGDDAGKRGGSGSWYPWQVSYNYYSAAVAPEWFGTSRPRSEPPGKYLGVAGQSAVGWPVPPEPPFVNWRAGNFHLKASMTNWSGTNLIGPDLPAFNLDPDGTLRGTNGVWDRGAYQYLPNTATNSEEGASALMLRVIKRSNRPGGSPEL